MQPNRQAAGNRAEDDSFRGMVADARAAWYRGEFELCLTILDRASAFTVHDASTAEAALLRARSLLRTKRAAEARDHLETQIPNFAGVDERYTARMLHATAIARDDARRGLALLDGLMGSAERDGVHSAIVAEISYFRGLAFWTAGDYDAADRAAAEAEGAGADAISVRASELRGCIALGQHRFADALGLFRSALRAYGACRERDGDMAASILLQVASLESTLRSSRELGTHDARSARRIPGAESFAAPGARELRALTAYVDAFLFANDGDADTALSKFAEAEALAPTDGFRAWVLSGGSIVAHALGERASARSCAKRALSLAEGVDWESVVGEERYALVFLAEALAPADPADAARMLARFDSIVSEMDPLEFARTDPRKAAVLEYVRGLVARAHGDHAAARKLLEAASRGFAACGYLWRRALALIELDATAVAGVPRGDFYLEAAAIIVRENFPRSFIARRLGRWQRAYSDSIAARLRPAEREILRFILDGKDPKEIAAVTGRAPSTVRNHVTALLSAFGVNSTLRMVAECHRRGIGAPASEDPMPTSPYVRVPHRNVG
jgi:DNA-binding NarL/FixJ family response regulator